MPITFDIPGGTATFRDKLSTERQRRPVKRAALAAAAAIAKLPPSRPDDDDTPIGELIGRLPLDRDEADSLFRLYDATIVAFLESWTLDRPLPDEDGLLDLDSDLYDALVAAAARLPGDAATDTVDFSPQPKVDNSTPTDNSGSSDGLSTADPELQSTLR